MPEERSQHSVQEMREHAEWLLSDKNLYGLSADEQLMCSMILSLVEQLETCHQARREEHLERCREVDRLEEQLEATRQALVDAAEANPWTHASDIAQKACERLGIVPSNPAKRPT